MSACGVCLLECLGPICTPGTSLFWVVLLEPLLFGHTVPPDSRDKEREKQDCLGTLLLSLHNI